MENKRAGEQYHLIYSHALTCLQDARLQKPGDKRSGGSSQWKWHLHFCPPHFISSPGSGPNVRPNRSPLCSQRKLSPTLAPSLSRVLPVA